MVTFEGEAARVPIHRAADCANIHRLVRLYFSPAQLTVCDKRLILIDFFGWQIRKIYDSILDLDEHDFLSAAGTGQMVPPPFDEAGQAELMATL